jgi:MprA protease rhombosortase-interaction domain-containing protein
MASFPLTKIWLWSACLLAFAGCAAFQRQPVTGADHVSVYYATTRQHDPAAAVTRAFTNAPTKHEFINFGTAEVSVPLPHSEGVQKGLRVETIEPPKKDGQGDFRNRTHAETGDPKRPLVVYVHGFNNSFETAAERAALFAHDLQPDVSTKAAIFSWPSHEKLFGYFADEDSVLVSQDRARQVVEILRTHDSASPVVLIGHSMGCRVLTFALRDIELIESKGKPPKLGHPQFAQLILIEPDVDAEYFRINIARLRAICGHVTVYASNHDNALRLSSFLHSDPREGELGSQGLLKKIDVIDASAAKTDLVGHSYDGPELFEDIRGLLHGQTVEQREGTTLVKHPPGVYALKR